jgi:predicted kinase
MKTLYIIRGLPGSGKSSLAELLTEFAYSADDFFNLYHDGVFKPELLKEAHAWCFEKVKDELRHFDDVAVANTFTQLWEMQPYLDLAKEFGYTPFVITCENNFGSVHGVPATTMDKEV